MLMNALKWRKTKKHREKKWCTLFFFTQLKFYCGKKAKKKAVGNAHTFISPLPMKVFISQSFKLSFFLLCFCIHFKKWAHEPYVNEEMHRAAAAAAARQRTKFVLVHYFNYKFCRANFTWSTNADELLHVFAWFEFDWLKWVRVFKCDAEINQKIVHGAACAHTHMFNVCAANGFTNMGIGRTPQVLHTNNNNGYNYRRVAHASQKHLHVWDDVCTDNEAKQQMCTKSNGQGGREVEIEREWSWESHAIKHTEFNRTQPKKHTRHRCT